MAKRKVVYLFVLACLATFALGWEPKRHPQNDSTGKKAMYGLIGKMSAFPGKRDELIKILLEGVHEMPGCLSYVVAKDAADADAIWISEVWDSKADHKASLSLPAVRNSITRGKPLIANFGQSIITEPIGGHGLAKTKKQ
jgi:quinol monooxygenase YgiN